MDGWIIHHVLRSLHLPSSWLQSRLGGFWAQDPKVHADSQTPWIHCLGSETDWLHRWMPEYVCVNLFIYIYIDFYMHKCLNMCTHICIYILIHIIALCIRGRSCLPNRSWTYKKSFSLQYGAINAKFENNQINTQPKYDHYQFNWPLATKNRPNQLTVPVWTEPNSNRTDGGCS